LFSTNQVVVTTVIYNRKTIKSGKLSIIINNNENVNYFIKKTKLKNAEIMVK